MRKVKFNKWIPRITEDEEFGIKVKEGTNCWEKDFPNDGVFHQWGLSTEEANDSIASYTIAILETPDGKVEEVFPFNLMFVDPLY